jgi:hypothetical protein
MFAVRYLDHAEAHHPGKLRATAALDKGAGSCIDEGLLLTIHTVIERMANAMRGRYFNTVFFMF